MGVLTELTVEDRVGGREGYGADDHVVVADDEAEEAAGVARGRASSPPATAEAAEARKRDFPFA
jgi:hypothetical protein